MDFFGEEQSQKVRTDATTLDNTVHQSFQSNAEENLFFSATPGATVTSTTPLPPLTGTITPEITLNAGEAKEFTDVMATGSGNGSAQNLVAANKESPRGLPTSPKTKSANLTNDTQKEIEARTANIDAKSREKEAKQTALAKAFLKDFNAQYEAKLRDAKAEHMRQQAETEVKQNTKADMVWDGVGLVLDLSKPNKYSRGTERMRSLLQKLGGTKIVSAGGDSPK